MGRGGTGSRSRVCASVFALLVGSYVRVVKCSKIASVGEISSGTH